jgi:hypothetical protein
MLNFSNLNFGNLNFSHLNPVSPEFCLRLSFAVDGGSLIAATKVQGRARANVGDARS